VDMDHQTDEAWVLSVQRKLYQWSKANPEDSWRDMWGWVTDLRVLRHAWQRVASNRGGRTAGIDGVTVGRIRNGLGEQRFLEGLQAELRSGAYRPSPARRKLIPKAGKPGQFRPLGIPTIKDRVVQGAIKTLLEPIFEAQFWHVSYGFRPRRKTHGALEYIRLPRPIRRRGGHTASCSGEPWCRSYSGMHNPQRSRPVAPGMREGSHVRRSSARTAQLARLLFHDHSAGPDFWPDYQGPDFDLDEIAAAQLAVDCHIEERFVSQPPLPIEKEADRPNLPRFQRARLARAQELLAEGGADSNRSLHGAGFQTRSRCAWRFAPSLA
jgi:hypothetical protein